MTGTKLLTREELLKEKFNEIKIDTKDAKKFLMYFGGILQLGISEDLIDEARRNLIANAITNAIELTTSNDDEYDTNYVQIRNYMYIVSSYLQSNSNWDAWLKLININSTEKAIALIKDAISCFNQKMEDINVLLTLIQPSISKLNISNVSNAYQILVSLMKNAVSSTSDITTFDLRDYHGIALNIGTYILMDDCNLQISENFFAELYNITYDFCMEVSILSNIDAKKLVWKKKKEADSYFANADKKIEAIDRIYKDKLDSLKKEFNENLNNCDDPIRIENEYSLAKLNIEQEWNEKISEYEKYLRKDEISQLEILNGEYSLYDLIKEFAIYQMALKEEICYPSTIKERSAILMILDSKRAILEFISGNKQVLTHEQIEFLKKKCK